MNTTTCSPARTHRQASASLALFTLSSVLAFAQTPQVVVGYYQESSAFPVSQLATNGALAHLTHLDYAFAKIVQTDTGKTDPATQKEIYSYACAPFDPAGELGPNGVFQQLKTLKQSNPKLKVLISIGGALGSGYFSDAASDTPANPHRQHFVQTCVDQFVGGQFASPAMTGVFDGVDIDWEYPGAADTDNYNSLLHEFRSQLDGYQQSHPGTQRLALTSAIGPRNNSDQETILFSGPTGAANYVDFFNIMTYDFAGYWNDAASSTAPMSAISGRISDFIAGGLPAGKIVLGIPFYGVHYTGNFSGYPAGTSLGTLLQQSSNAPVTVPGDPYRSTQTTSYANIVRNTLTLQNGSTNSNVGVSHDADASAWAFDASTGLLWAYDDETTIAAKAVYARNLGLAGIMTWDISQDTAASTLLCAMETGAAGSATSVCGSAPVNNPPPSPGTVIFDFEGDQQGWARTGNVFSVSTSTDYANTGAQSLAAHFITYRQTFQPHGTVFVTPPAQVQPGSTVEFRIWVPRMALTNSYLTGIIPFFMDKNWAWTGNPANLSALTGDAWNTVTVQVPANAVAPFNQIGIQFDCSGTWDGIVYIDTVKVR